MPLTLGAVLLGQDREGIRPAHEIAAQLQRDHRRFGLTRWTVFADRPDLQPAEVLAPVIALLRG